MKWNEMTKEHVERFKKLCREKLIEMGYEVKG